MSTLLLASEVEIPAGINALPAFRRRTLADEFPPRGWDDQVSNPLRRAFPEAIRSRNRGTLP